jgi:CRP-like cAMP-binding protein
MTAPRRKGKVAAMAKPSPDLIRGIPIFAELDDASVNQLSSDFIEREFGTGDAIATEGEGGLNFFVVESGTAEVSVGGRSVATLGPGASFGEVALVDKSARTATVTATSTLRAFALPVWSFRSFAESRPSVTWKLLELLAERLRTAEHR